MPPPAFSSAEVIRFFSGSGFILFFLTRIARDGQPPVNQALEGFLCLLGKRQSTSPSVDWAYRYLCFAAFRFGLLHDFDMTTVWAKCSPSCNTLKPSVIELGGGACPAFTCFFVLVHDHQLAGFFDVGVADYGVNAAGLFVFVSFRLHGLLLRFPLQIDNPRHRL